MDPPTALLARGGEVRVIAVDPGGTTGYAEWDSERGLIAFGQIDEWMTACSLLLDRHPDVIVCESFRITVETAKKARSYDALYQLGVFKYECAKLGIAYDVQAPGDRMFATPKKLATMGWEPKGDHAKSATMHLLTWLFNNGHITPLELSLGDC